MIGHGTRCGNDHAKGELLLYTFRTVTLCERTRVLIALPRTYVYTCAYGYFIRNTLAEKSIRSQTDRCSQRDAAAEFGRVLENEIKIKSNLPGRVF